MESKQEKIAEVESEGKGRHSEDESGRHSEQTHELSAIVSRARQSRWPAVPMEEAYKSIETVLKEIDPCFKYEPVVALQPGQVLAEKITAPADVPTCCKSIKDGYAVLFADGAGDREVVGSSTAGAPFTGSMTNSQCVRVSTGAVVPACADAVVQVEDTEIVKHDNKEELVIKIKKAPSRIGQDIRKPGDDMRKGDLLFDVGCTLSAGEIGVINEIGLKVVAVYRRPKVCVMSTGNELVESMTEEIPPGCIRDSNRPQLLALFKSLGFKPIDAGIAPDRRSDLVVAIKNAFGYASVLVTSGGVSMGEHDLLKDILENDLGFKIHFGRVWMKPGMPATFATGVIGGELRCVFALPGNPVSSWACAHLFAAPLLRHLAGHLKIYNSRIYVKLADGVKLGERPEYKRAWLQMPDRMTDEMQDEFWKPRQETGQVQKEKQLELLPIAHITGGQLSSRLASTIGANVLLELPQKSDGLTQLERGEVVQAFVIASI